jgi:uncharacterized protein YjeT (DUF2065 family)
MTSELAMVTTAIGVLIVLIRAPLIFAPQTTLEIYRKLLETHARIRVMGACVVALGVALAVSSQGVDQTAAQVIFAFSCIIALGALVGPVVYPSAYKRMADTLLAAVEDSTTLRAFGVLGAGIGALLVYLGLWSF